MSQIHLLTGATSGMGLHVAERLATRRQDIIIAGARNPAAAVALQAVVPASQLIVLPLDTSRLASVAAFVSAVQSRLQGRNVCTLSCIAGLQILGPRRLTEDGIDETFAANFLGHAALVQGLLGNMASGGTIVTRGSGTHNPDHPGLRSFGFTGADFPDAVRVASGTGSRDRNQTGAALDRYATSKLCAILYALDMSTRIPATTARFVVYDPGLMPGTRLARDRSWGARFAGTYILPLLRPVMFGVSTSRQSALRLVDSVLWGKDVVPSGAYIDFNGQAALRSPLSQDRAVAAELFNVAQHLIAQRTHAAAQVPANTASTTSA